VMPISLLNLPWFTGAPAGTAVTALWFFLAVLLLDSFDISLPRGDSIDVSGAVSAAAVVALGPVWAVFICLGSATVTHVARNGGSAVHRFAGVVVARVCALAAATVVLFVFALFPSASPALLYGAVSAAFLATELVGAQFVASMSTGRPFGRLLRGNLRVQAPLLVAQWSAAVLLLMTVGKMGPWSLIPVVALLFLMRQSYAMLLNMRELYRTTVEVLVEAAEAQDVRRIGHAERTAAAAREIAMRVGLSATQVERISYAALLHDVDTIGEPSDVEFLHDGSVGDATAGGSPVFEGVHFFEDVLPVIKVCGGSLDADAKPTSSDTLAGLIVAIASDSDAAQHRDVAAAHSGNSVDRVAPWASAAMKSTVVGAALALGYRVPAVN
jgi:hypothetical protein